MSAVVWEDVLKKKYAYLTESRKTVVTKVLGEGLEHSRSVQSIS